MSLMSTSAPIRVECLILDLFGVIVAFDDRLVSDQIAQRCQHPLVAFEKLQDLVSDPRLIRGHTSLEVLHARLRDDFGFEASPQAFTTLWTSSYSEPMPGIRALIRELHSQCRLVLLSNVDPHYWPTVSASVPELALFHAKVLSFERGIAKPEEAAFKAAIAMAGAPVELCYFVDDKPENVAAAARRGLAGHVFESVVGLKAQLRKSGLRVS